ncbi:DUF4625 domain-containing protein [Pedobacter nyackensis]|uniref:DUF4625 domain-containing protein n=1 Tax=Pedobacter nyackensis TaxID=475255 RepID=UPI00292CD820|nr:DUF4625 domain-containing protein [Pedobacter nyackensis]
MKRLSLLSLCLASMLVLSNCSKDTAKPIDTAYPEINTSADDTFPKQCSIIKRGEKFIFRASVSDNAELGSLNVDIHHNFDHHTHSTELEECNMEAIKQPAKPFLLIRNITIPTGQKTFQASAEIQVPADIDPGDYHFMIRLTDKEGWQTIKGLSIKIQ